MRVKLDIRSVELREQMVFRGVRNIEISSIVVMNSSMMSNLIRVIDSSVKLHEIRLVDNSLAGRVVHLEK
jgi:hypothetical protein